MDHDLIHTEADVDDLISDIHHLIDETPQEEAPAAPELPQVEPEAAPIEPEAEPEAAPAEEPAPEEHFQQQRWTDRQKVPKHVARLQNHQQEAYAQWLKEQEEKGEEGPPVFEEVQPKKKKKPQNHSLWTHFQMIINHSINLFDTQEFAGNISAFPTLSV